MRGAGPESSGRSAPPGLGLEARPAPRRGAQASPAGHRAIGRRDCSTAERAMEATAAQIEPRAADLQSEDFGHSYFCLFLSPLRIRGGGIVHLRAKTQLEPGEIQAGSGVGVDGGMLEVEGALQSLVVLAPRFTA